MYLYFGGTLPGRGERKTLEVSLQTEVFRLPAPSRARAALRAAGTKTGEEDFGEAVRNTGVSGPPWPGRVRAVPVSQGFSVVPRHDLLWSWDRYCLTFGRGRWEVERQAGATVGR